MRIAGFVAALFCAGALMLCTPTLALAAEEDASADLAGATTAAPAASSEIVSVEALPRVIMPGDDARLEVQAAPGTTVTAVWLESVDEGTSWKLEASPMGNNRFRCEIDPPEGVLWPDMWQAKRVCFVDSRGVEGEVWNRYYSVESQGKLTMDMDSSCFAIYAPDNSAVDVIYELMGEYPGLYGPYTSDTDVVEWVIADESILRLDSIERIKYDDGTCQPLVRFTPIAVGRTGVYCLVNGDLRRATCVSVTSSGFIDMSQIEIRLPDDSYDYTGEPVCPKPVVSFEGRVFEEGVDYTLSYENNIEPGTATVIVKAIGGAFAGVKEANFRIVDRNLELQDFLDVAPGSWYYEPVMYAASYGLVQGYGDTGFFGPDDTLTRAQAAVILCRYFTPEMDLDHYQDNWTGMADVEGYTWYTNAANWAVGTGVIGGRVHPDGTASFDPHDTITREELCTMVARAASSFRGADIAGADWSDMLSTQGHDEVSSWASESVAWCMDNGVVNGVSEPDGRHVRPQGVVTRATMAQVMMNAIEGGVM